MWIKSVDISGFRAFSGSHQFDLDGDIVLVIGVNGQGKTSLFDAIHWAITGEISRIGRPDSVVSLYSPSGEARVQVTLVSADGRMLDVIRHSDGEKVGLLVSAGKETFRNEDADYELLRFLWPDGLAASDSRVALRSALERGVYLQQDVLTDFLTADTDQDRFRAISELIGAGRTTEFQEALQRSRRAWSRTTTQRVSQMEEREDRLSRLEGQLQNLAGARSVTPSFAGEWTAWWTQARNLGVSSAGVPRVNSSDAPRVIDAAMAELRALRLSLERRGDRLRELSLTLQDLPSMAVDLDTLRKEAEEASRELEAARTTLAEAEKEAAEARRRQVEVRSQREDLRVLAEIALRHLGQECPVCQQTYDIDSTRERLSRLREADQPTAVEPVELPFGDLGLIGLMKHVQGMEEEASAAASTLQDAQRRERVRADSQERIRSGLTELGITVSEGDSIARAIDSALQENTSNLENLSEVRLRGEALALSLARTGQIARQAEVEQEVQRARLDLSGIRNDVKARQATGELVSKMIDGLRDASSDLVERELVRLEPLLRRIYATADPHPEFRNVKLLSRMYRGSGRVLAEIEDPLHDRRSEAPSAFLSSSQMNVLAVSVFLALNLGIPTLPLNVAILDDPLQSLDDLNLLGLIDLLKRMRERRQLMVSTHDSRFASLLERKLRPVSESQRTILLELNGWSSEGPRVAQRDVVRDLIPIRIAAA